MSELRKIVKSSIYVFAAFVIAAVFGYLSKVLLARMLGPSEFGMFTLSLTVTYIFSAFAIAGVGTSITYYLSKEKDKSRRNAFFSALFLISVLSLLLLSVVLILFPSKIASIFGNTNLVNISYFLAGFTFLYGITRVMYSILRGEEKSKVFAIFYAAIPTLYFTLIYLLKVSTARQALLFYVVTYLSIDLFLFPYISKKVKFVKPDFNLVKKVFSFSVVLFLVEVLFSLRRWTDVWMLSLLSSVANIGFYNVAALSAFAFNMALMSMNFLYLPVSNKLFHQNKLSRLREVYNKICFILTMVVSPFAIALTIFAPQFISLVFGRTYLPSVAPFSILMVSTLVNVMFGPNWTNLVIRQEKRLLVLFALFALILNAILNYLFIPTWGIAGAAIATAVSIIAWNVITTIAIWKKQKMTPFSKSMFKSLSLALVVSIPFLVARYFVSLSVLWAIIFGIGYLSLYTLLVDRFVIKLRKVVSFVFRLS
ncbi:MAG: oligosaccharide flippase family protein [Nanoarchaeota archaeon]|nr:oligosaccharide flippase family protein [Nanoarchaeota archaeon]